MADAGAHCVSLKSKLSLWLNVLSRLKKKRGRFEICMIGVYFCHIQKLFLCDPPLKNADSSKHRFSTQKGYKIS